MLPCSEVRSAVMLGTRDKEMTLGLRSQDSIGQEEASPAVLSSIHYLRRFAAILFPSHWVISSPGILHGPTERVSGGWSNWCWQASTNMGREFLATSFWRLHPLAKFSESTSLFGFLPEGCSMCTLGQISVQSGKQRHCRIPFRSVLDQVSSVLIEMDPCYSNTITGKTTLVVTTFPAGFISFLHWPWFDY